MPTNIENQLDINIEAPASKVWQALTDPLIIKNYFFGTKVETDWQPGRPITFTGEYQGKSYQDRGTVLDFQEPTTLSYSYWSSMGKLEDTAENYMNLTFHLDEANGRTNLHLTQANIHDEETRKQTAENWKTVLDSIKRIVEKSAGQPFGSMYQVS